MGTGLHGGFGNTSGAKKSKLFTPVQFEGTVKVNGELRDGPELREPHSKHLEDGIFELRAKLGSDISRVLYFFFVGMKAILTNGFIKKTMKAPNSEIELAKRYRKDYLMRNLDGR